MKTTLNIEQPVLAELRRLARQRHRSMGTVASELLAEALKESEEENTKPYAFQWRGKDMRARVDLDDRNAIYDAMDTTDNP